MNVFTVAWILLCGTALIVPQYLCNHLKEHDFEQHFAALPFFVAFFIFTIALCTLLKRRWATIISSTLFIVVFIVSILEYTCDRFSGHGFDFTMLNGMRFSDLIDYTDVFQKYQLAAATLTVIAVSILGLWLTTRLDVKEVSKRLAWGLLIAGIMGMATTPSALRNLNEVVKTEHALRQPMVLTDKDFTRTGIKSTTIESKQLQITTPAVKKNLVMIYLESTDDAWYDQQNFPGMMPNLVQLRHEGYSFDNVVGSVSAVNTITSICSSMSGCRNTDIDPDLFRGNQFDQVGKRLFSFPSILKAAGYRQCFMIGHDKAFFNTGKFIYGFGYDEVWSSADYSPYKERDSTMGAYDDELLDEAYQKFCRMAKQNQPFNLTILTADSHGPDGRTRDIKIFDHYAIAYSITAPKHRRRLTERRAKREKELLRTHNNLWCAYHNTDAAVGTFIERLKAHPAWKDTVVFVMNDHYAWWGSLDPKKTPEQRRMAIFTLNSYKGSGINTIRGKHFDIAPTVLDLLEIKTNYDFPQGESLVGTTHNPRRLEEDVDQQKVLIAYLTRKSRLF